MQKTFSERVAANALSLPYMKRSLYLAIEAVNYAN